ncbi:MAG TPA: imidazolonepropionase, partial [Burkholderiaceae bacterium]|nr:imidazolonepropionase [Burkholderiaceae bacterium]
MKTLWRHARLATMTGNRPWGWVERGALLTEDGRLRWVGPEDALPAALEADLEHDLGGALVTPGLIDCHTHLVYGGHRAREFEQRLQGATYEEIARGGGGIRSTVAATRAAADATLFA